MRLTKLQSSRKKISSSHKTQDGLQLSHDVEVFDILEPQGTGQIYSNPLMNCTSMGEYSDVLSAHDRWKDGRRLKMLQHMECVRSGDIGFAQMSGQPETDRLDMGFPLRSQINRLSTPPSILALDMGFQPAGQLDPRHACDTMNSSSNTAVVCPASTSGSDMSIENDPLDMGFSSLLEEDEHVVQRPLDMGFCRDPVHDVAARSLDMQLDQLPLNMGFQTDPASCHSLDIEPDDRSLDMGFDTLQPERHPLDMGFNTLQPDACPLDPVFNELQPDGHPLDMGFNTLQLDVGSLDPAFNAIQLDEHPLDMGFGALHPVHPDQSMDIQLDQKPLDMGFGTATPDPVHGLPDQSFADGEPEPIGFVIQCAVGDLGLAIHWLEMDRPHSTMSPEEAYVSQEVLQSAHELLLAFQLISIYRLST